MHQNGGAYHIFVFERAKYLCEGIKMRIVVNDIAASNGGALSILKDFYQYLVKNDKGNKWIFLLGDKYIEETKNIKVITLEKVKSSWIKRLKFDLFSGKNFVESLNPDVVFSLQNTITFGLKVPQILYVHQSIPFQKIKKFSFLKSDERTLAIYQYIIGGFIKLSSKKADKIIVQTKWMKKAVITLTNINEGKITNILPDIEDFSSYKKENIFDELSFFYPTAVNIYKNNEYIYKACELLRQKGIKNFNIKMTLPNNKQIENIEFIGKIQREQVIYEYNKSTLIFPSYIETFGLPMSEARQMGGIVLASDCEFSREVLENYENAYFFDPFKPEELANLMEKVISGDIAREEITNVKVNEKNNSWEQVVNEIVRMVTK